VSSDARDVSDETLMAYVDGELDAAERARVESAIAASADVARRVARHRALRQRLRAFDDVLDETIPAHLLNVARKASPDSVADGVTDLSAARARKAAQTTGAARRWSWPEWGAMAASVVIGVLVSMLYLRPDAGSPFATRGDQLVARGDLARALSNQLGGEAVGADGAKIPVSFRSKSGELCRAFVLGSQSGLACRSGNKWAVQVLARAEAAGGEGTYRPAGSALPPLVTQAVDERIEGEPLDARSEAIARDRDWHVP
jgi:hypothetical protein